MLAGGVTYQRLGFGGTRSGLIWTVVLSVLLQYDVDGERVAALLPRT